MFSDPKSLAKHALALLELADMPDISDEQIAAIELGAATLCNHVRDWHLKAGISPTLHGDFVALYPDWRLLNQISNGTKHAKEIMRSAHNRQIRWGDLDFWGAPHARETLFVEASGEPRSVAKLVHRFATEYLDAT